MSSGGYCRIFWGRVPCMSWYFSGDLINQCDLSNICCALQLTWKLTNHMKISPCLQDMLCFVKCLPTNYSIIFMDTPQTSLKSRATISRLPFCFLWWCYNHHPISPTGFGYLEVNVLIGIFVHLLTRVTCYCASCATYEPEKIWVI